MKMIIGFATLALVGCSFEKSVSRSIDEGSVEIKKKIESTIGTPGSNSVEVLEGAYVGSWVKTATVVRRSPRLSVPISLSFDSPMPPQFLLSLVTEQTKLPIKLNSESSAILSNFSEGVDAGKKGIYANFSGSASQYLDDLTARTGLFWTSDEESVRIFLTQTKVFDFFGPMATLAVNSGITKAGSGGGAGAGSGATSDQSVKLSVQADTLKEVETSVKSMLSTAGKVTISEAAGKVVVTDTPMVLDRVSTFMDSLNASLSAPISLHVRVFEVTSNRASDTGIRWDTVWENLSSRYRVNLSSGPATPALGSSNIGFAVIDPSYTYGGSKSLASALATQGTVKELQDGVILTTNRRPAVLAYRSDRVYLAKTTSVAVPNAGILQDATPGTVSTGFVVSLVPQLMPGNQILVHGLVDLSTLVAIRSVDGGSSKIEAPELSARQTMPTIRLRSGETAVFAGLDTGREELNEQGLVKPSWWLGGGSAGAKRSRGTIVMEITARAE